MPPVLYEVTATFSDPAAIDDWLQWMVSTHIPEVLRCGAACGRAVRLDEPANVCVALYEFDSRPHLDDYLARHAPRLRPEGAQRFGPDQVTYTRRIGSFFESVPP